MAAENLAESLEKVNTAPATSAEILDTLNQEEERRREFEEDHPRNMFPAEVRQALRSIRPDNVSRCNYAVILWANIDECHNLQEFCDLLGESSVVCLN